MLQQTLHSDIEKLRIQLSIYYATADWESMSYIGIHGGKENLGKVIIVLYLITLTALKLKFYFKDLIVKCEQICSNGCDGAFCENS